MAGFAARLEKSTGVHDPTSVRAIIFNDVALLTVDCCALHEDTCREIRDRAIGATGLSEVVVAATHTHSGPGIGLRGLGEHSPSTLAEVVRVAHQTLTRAWIQREECLVEFSSTRGVGIAKNRRDGRAINPPVSCLKATHEGKVVGTLVSYPCHPVVLDGTNTLISGDYPHFTREYLEENMGGVSVFMTGCAGDVNTGHKAEDSYQKNISSTRTFSEAQRIGHRIAEVVYTSDFTRVTGNVSVTSHRVTLSLERITKDRVASDRATWQKGIDSEEAGSEVLRVWRDWADEWRPDYSTSWSARTTFIRIGDVTVCAMPGEPFLDCSIRLEHALGERTISLGYCDGVPGYFPVKGEYDKGGYEVKDAHRYYAMPAPFQAGSAEALLKTFGVT